MGRCPALLRPLLTSRSALRRRPFRHEARSPQVRVVTFPAQPPDLRRLPLVARASRSLARSPWSAPPPIRFLFVGSRFRSPLLSALPLGHSPCGSLGVAATSFPKGLSPPGHAHAGHTRTEGPLPCRRRPFLLAGSRAGTPEVAEAVRPEKGGNLFQRRPRSAGRPPRPPPWLFLAGGHPIQSFLVLEDEEPALVRQQRVPLHLVDQGRYERARGADQIRQVLLRDAVQAELVSGSDALAVRLGQGDEHLGQPRRDVLAGQAENALAELPDPLIERADHVDRERRPRLEQRAEVAAFDAPHLALARGDGQLLRQRPVRAEDLAEEIAGLEDREHRAALALALPEQPHAAGAEQVDLVRGHSRPVDDGAVAESLDLEIAAEIHHVSRGKAGRGERLELLLVARVSLRTHAGAPYEGDVSRLSEHQTCQRVSSRNLAVFTKK